MKPKSALVLIAAALIIGAWISRELFPPVELLTPDVLALAEHFRKSGINVRPYPVGNRYPRSILSAAAAFQIEDFPLPVSVDVCPDAVVASKHLADVMTSPNLVGPMQNGRLVMYLPMWGADTADMAVKVHNAFASFHDQT